MDAGQSWQSTKVTGQPVSFVYVAGDGRIFAFVVGIGLLQGEEGSAEWETLSDDFGYRILLHFATDPSNVDRLYAVAQKVRFWPARMVVGHGNRSVLRASWLARPI